MTKYLLLVLLLATQLQLATSNYYFLSPPFPPTAFEEQHYEVRFRVRGMLHPTFTYENLPDFLSGTTDGVVSGTPLESGTYRFSLSYSNG